MINEFFKNEIDAVLYLGKITGYRYCFAVCTSRKWGSEESEVEYKNNNEPGFYQIMPDNSDDGFFDWYCLERTYNQFFETRETAVIHFLKYWHEWKKQQIVKVIGTFVDLKQQGQYYIGLCPLHDETVPSLTVTPHRNYFKCYGCGASGDSKEFIRLYFEKKHHFHKEEFSKPEIKDFDELHKLYKEVQATLIELREQIKKSQDNI